MFLKSLQAAFLLCVAFGAVTFGLSRNDTATVAASLVGLALACCYGAIAHADLIAAEANLLKRQWTWPFTQRALPAPKDAPQPEPMPSMRAVPTFYSGGKREDLRVEEVPPSVNKALADYIQSNIEGQAGGANKSTLMPHVTHRLNGIGTDYYRYRPILERYFTYKSGQLTTLKDGTTLESFRQRILNGEIR